MRATGREMQLTRQIGEHLVAAELGRLGYVAAPFAGNVPMFDLLAANALGHATPVQVKTIRGGSWQFSIDTFLTIEFQGRRQVVRGKKALPVPNLLCIFVLLVGQGADEFFIFELKDLQNHFVRSYKGRIRPKNFESMHCAVGPKDLKRFEGNWQLIEKFIGPSK
ncbi:MAG: hypothetical protein ACK4JB_05370 [Reyranella sp.]